MRLRSGDSGRSRGEGDLRPARAGAAGHRLRPTRTGRSRTYVPSEARVIDAVRRLLAAADVYGMGSGRRGGAVRPDVWRTGGRVDARRLGTAAMHCSSSPARSGLLPSRRSSPSTATRTDSSIVVTSARAFAYPASRVPRSSASDLAVRSRDDPRASPSVAPARHPGRRQSRVVAHAFKLPDLGEGLTEGEVARWLVVEGQEVREDDPLVEIQTDKSDGRDPISIRRARFSGYSSPRERSLRSAPSSSSSASWARTSRNLLEHRGRQATEYARPRRKPRPRRAFRPTPVVRRIAAELGVDLVAVHATGPGGRITEDDVRDAITGVSTTEGRREKIRGVRRVVAEHVAALTARSRGDMGRGVRFRECADGPARGCRGERMRGSAAEFPELNARLEGDEIVYLERYDIGVAVQTEQGLVVPVVRGVDSRSVDEDQRGARPAGGGRARRHPRGCGAPRLHVHGDECRQACGPLSDADRQLPGGRDPQHRTHRAGGSGGPRIGSRSSCASRAPSPYGFDHRVVDGCTSRRVRARDLPELSSAHKLPASIRRSTSRNPPKREGEGCRARIVGVVFVLRLAGRPWG